MTAAIIDRVWGVVEGWLVGDIQERDAIGRLVGLRDQYNEEADLLDQGITRLQLLSFLRGEHSARWNGGDLKWVVYRRHQIDRECSPDATIIRLAYTGHQTGTNTAVIEAVPGSDVDAATALRVIDTIIDAAIAHHGPDGVA